VGSEELPNPACPSIVRDRDQSALSKLPPDSDILDTFAGLRADNDLSDEEALLKFITSYDVRTRTFLVPGFCWHQNFAGISHFSDTSIILVSTFLWYHPAL
jgi:hypothetical protein